MKEKGIKLGLSMLCSLLAGCGTPPSECEIGSLSYDVNPKGIYTVYLKEYEEYVPYLVLTADDENHTMLLRRDILSEAMPFRESGVSYYGDSTVDTYLNTEFIDRFDAGTAAQIVEHDLMVTPEDWYSDTADTIRRKVFLLSATEVNIHSNLMYDEGDALKYFKDGEHLKANRDGQPCSWSLRSGYLAERTMIWGITPEGQVGGGAMQAPIGVRPAFWVDSSTVVEQEKIPAEEAPVYVIADR